MLNRTFLLLLLFCAYFNSTAFCQTKISREEALADIDFLVNQSFEIHPDLYALADSTSFNKEIRILNTENDSILKKDFYLHLQRFVNRFRDGHTFVSSSGIEGLKAIRNSRISLPIEISDKNLYLIGVNKEALHIDSINGISSTQLYTDLIELVNGEFMDYREQILKDQFVYFFQLKYGKTSTLEISQDGRKKQYPIHQLEHKHPDYLFSLINDTVGTLTLNSFSFNKKEAKQYKAFIDSSFNVLHERKVTTLLIDVSEHQGGNSSYGDYVLNYLTNEPYVTYEYQLLKRSKISKKYFKKNFIKWYMYPIAIFSKQAHLVALKKEGIDSLSTKPTKPEKTSTPFHGSTYLITSPKTYSAGATMTVSFNNANIGKIIGGPIGQPCRGFLDLVPYELPNSKIVIATSFKEYQYANCNNRIEPEISVKKDNSESQENFYKSILEMLSTY